jgi:hypothetical protein
MARLKDMDASMREFQIHMPVPKIDISAWVRGPALTQRRIALISSAGFRRRSDRPFADYAADYFSEPTSTS